MSKKKKRPVVVKTRIWHDGKNNEDCTAYSTPGWHDLEFKGLFHQWGEEAEHDNINGFGNFTIGIVEDENGQIHTVNPNHIQFTDR